MEAKRSPYTKYPRTLHLPWSKGLSSDDKMIPMLDEFYGNEIVVTEKMDGENTTMYRDHIHARSINSNPHPSRDWVKAFWATIHHEIPEGWRVCGENLYAKHSIHYTDLPSYFLGFSVWDEYDRCLCWEDTVGYMEEFGVTPVPIIYKGIYDEDQLKELAFSQDPDTTEGYVIRLTGEFFYGCFETSVAKYVREGHVQTSDNWLHNQMVTNQLQLKRS